MPHEMTHCREAYASSEAQLAAVGVDLRFLGELSWAALKLLRRKLGREGFKRWAHDWADAVGGDFIDAIDTPGPDRIIDPLAKRVLAGLVEVLVDRIEQHSEEDS